MLAILATHPIQYHVPLWQMLARDGRVPFEVWYLSTHATQESRDREFGKEFAWDLDMLSGYRYRLLETPAGATPNTPLRSRISQSLPDLFREAKTKVLWVQGWQVAAYWQAIWAADKAGVEVWLRGESNAMREAQTIRLQDDETTRPGSMRKAQTTGLQDHETTRPGSVVRGQWSGGPKNWAKRILLGQLFKRVDHFLCIGTANRELYRSYGVPESKLHMAPYAVDNERFGRQAEAIRGQRSVVRSQWSIPEGSFVVLFCGKFIPKKRPLDLIAAAQLLLRSHPEMKMHLLFAGSGELGAEMRGACNVVFDAEQRAKGEGQGAKSEEQGAKRLTTDHGPLTSGTKPPASFAGFLNQTEISAAYVAADVLVLPSDYSETWGLVVNEAMASGLHCIMSDRCGCALDLGKCAGNAVFPFGDASALADAITAAAVNKRVCSQPPSLQSTVDLVRSLYLAT